MAQLVKNLPADAGDTRDVDLMPGLGRSPGGGNGNPLQYSCLENPTDRGAWQATVRGISKSQTRLSTHTPLETHVSTPVRVPCTSFGFSLPIEPAPGGTGSPEFEITESMP